MFSDKLDRNIRILYQQCLLREVYITTLKINLIQLIQPPDNENRLILDHPLILRPL